jgi:phosphoglucosamine mutase
MNSMKAFFKPNFLNNLKIVLDCANGATYKLAPAIFKYFGADVTAIFNEPNGTNINDNCGALHIENLTQTVLKHQAIAGFAFDGDGDRLISINKHGQVRDGDDVLFMLLGLPYYKDTPKVVGTVMSNQGLQNALTRIGKEFVRANVGDKHVAAILEKDGLLLGGEPSGHTILKDYLATGDGIFVALKIAESMILNQNFEMKSFAKYPQVLLNIPVARKQDLALDPFAKIISKHEAQLCGGRALVRFSGTEKLLRIMTEAESLPLAQSVARDLAGALRKLLCEE